MCFLCCVVVTYFLFDSIAFVSLKVETVSCFLDISFAFPLISKHSYNKRGYDSHRLFSGAVAA